MFAIFQNISRGKLIIYCEHTLAFQPSQTKKKKNEKNLPTTLHENEIGTSVTSLTCQMDQDYSEESKGWRASVLIMNYHIIN